MIFGLGLVAFSCGTIGGLLFAKLMNLFLREKINPAHRGPPGCRRCRWRRESRTRSGQESNPGNYLLSHAMGPNVAGVIGSAVVAGVFLTLAPAEGAAAFGTWFS